MKTIMTLSALFLFISGPAFAGSGYDSCIKEEQALKAREKDECNGLRYLLNPSACYATQRILKEYRGGKCRQIGLDEKVDFNAQPVVTEKRISSAANGPAGKSDRAASVKPAAAEPVGAAPAGPASAMKTEAGAVRQEATLDQLKEENALLRTEVKRLKAENEQLRQAGR